jgi:hypothetical protein
MTWIYSGDVTLPDGRIVHGRVLASVAFQDNALDIDDVQLEWKDGEALTADEYNEDLGDSFLHEYVTDKLCETTPELYVYEPI